MDYVYGIYHHFFIDISESFHTIAEKNDDFIWILMAPILKRKALFCMQLLQGLVLERR